MLASAFFQPADEVFCSIIWFITSRLTHNFIKTFIFWKFWQRHCFFLIYKIFIVDFILKPLIISFTQACFQAVRRSYFRHELHNLKQKKCFFYLLKYLRIIDITTYWRKMQISKVCVNKDFIRIYCQTQLIKRFLLFSF